MTESLRVGIIGLGFGQRVLLPAFRADARCEVVGVCASRWEHATAVAADCDIPLVYRDWRELVEDPRIDAVVIAAPPQLHCPIATAALALKKPVFCEKPLATSEAAAKHMSVAAAEAGVANMVDFEFPEIPHWRRARALLVAGAIGQVRHVRLCWHVETAANRLGLKSWKTSVAQGGGALNDFASHCFHYLEWLLGPIGTVSVAPFDARERDSGSDSLAVLWLTLADGTVVSGSVSTAAPFGDGHSLTVNGDAGTLALVNRSTDYASGFELFLGTRKTGSLEAVPVDRPRHDHDGRIAAVGGVVERFLTWALGGNPGRPNFEDGLRIQTLVEAAWRSRMQGICCTVSPTSIRTANG